MSRNELIEAYQNAALDTEVAELKKAHPPTTPCVLMGPMGQTDIMSLNELLSYADAHYDMWDYIELHACTLESYMRIAEETTNEKTQ